MKKKFSQKKVRVNKHTYPHNTKTTDQMVPCLGDFSQLSNLNVIPKKTSIFRVIHNHDNPYVQLNKESLWDKDLSLKSVGLLARCLSFPNDWKFSMQHLISICKEGKTAVYNALRELLQCKYMVKIQHCELDERGKFIPGTGGVEYLIFERPVTEEEKWEYIDELKASLPHSRIWEPGIREKEEDEDEEGNGGKNNKGGMKNSPIKSSLLKGSFRCSSSGHAQNLHAGNRKLLKKENTKHTKKREGITRASARPPLLSSSAPNAPAAHLTLFFTSTLKEINPKLSPPKGSRWIDEMERMLTEDGHQEEEIKKVIEYVLYQHDHATKDFRWSFAINSPHQLRKHFSTLWLEMKSIGSKKAQENTKHQESTDKKKMIEQNSQLSLDIKSKLDNEMPYNHPLSFIISDNVVHLGNRKTKENHVLSFTDKGFKHVLFNFINKTVPQFKFT
jgi:hypothetical protein